MCRVALSASTNRRLSNRLVVFNRVFEPYIFMLGGGLCFFENVAILGAFIELIDTQMIINCKNSLHYLERNIEGTRHGASAPTRNTPRHVPRFASPNK
jgi:hypothetical protein